MEAPIGCGVQQYGQFGGIASLGSKHSLAVLHVTQADSCIHARWGQNTFGQVKPTSTASLIHPSKEVLHYVAAPILPCGTAGRLFNTGVSLLHQFSTWERHPELCGNLEPAVQEWGTYSPPLAPGCQLRGA